MLHKLIEVRFGGPQTRLRAFCHFRPGVLPVNDYDLHIAAPRPLVEAARLAAPGMSLGATVRLALARFVGWPEHAAQAVAGPRKNASSGGQVIAP